MDVRSESTDRLGGEGLVVLRGCEGSESIGMSSHSRSAMPLRVQIQAYRTNALNASPIRNNRNTLSGQRPRFACKIGCCGAVERKIHLRVGMRRGRCASKIAGNAKKDSPSRPVSPSRTYGRYSRRSCYSSSVYISKAPLFAVGVKGVTGGKLRRGAIELETCLHRFPLCVLDPAVSGTKGLSACRFRAHHSRKLPVLSFWEITRLAAWWNCGMGDGRRAGLGRRGRRWAVRQRRPADRTVEAELRTVVG